MEWVSMHEHLDQALHDSNVEDLEKQWRQNFKDSSNDALGYVPKFIFEDNGTTMWSGATVPETVDDAVSYMAAYRSSGQFVLSRTNHHIHPKDAKTGERMSLNACLAKGKKRGKIKECKNGAPWREQCTDRTKLVCPGLARKHHLKVCGQRNALGSYLIRRRDVWFAPTAAALATVFRANSNSKWTWLVPLTEATYFSDVCKMPCLSGRKRSPNTLLVTASRAAKQLIGYFCGYTTERQVVGKYE